MVTYDECLEMFEKICQHPQIKEHYEVVPSCNQDRSMYLIPKGTIDQLSYMGKPLFSFRVSDHWNWYSNLKKCPDPEMVQCFSVDAPRPRERVDEKATKPIWIPQICFYTRDNKYHCVFGELKGHRDRRQSLSDILKQVIKLCDI